MVCFVFCCMRVEFDESDMIDGIDGIDGFDAAPPGMLEDCTTSFLAVR